MEKHLELDKLIRYSLLMFIITTTGNRLLAQDVGIFYQHGQDTLFTNGLFRINWKGNPDYEVWPHSAGVWNFESEHDSSLIRLNSFYEYKTGVLNAFEYLDTNILGYCMEVYLKDGSFLFCQEETNKESFFIKIKEDHYTLIPSPFCPDYRVRNINANHFIIILQYSIDWPYALYYENRLVKLTPQGIDFLVE